jgi:hypothetical protein
MSIYDRSVFIFFEKVIVATITKNATPKSISGNNTRELNKICSNFSSIELCFGY